jgi:glycosyltransferase 2 family protein
MNGKPFETAGIGYATPRPKMFKAIKLSIQLAFGALLLWWIATWINLDAKQLIETFSQASLLPLTFAVVCFAISMVLKALQCHIFLPPSSSRIYLTGVAFSQNALLTFLPWRIGEMSLPLLLRKDCGISVASSLSMLMVIRLVDLLIVLAVALVGSRRLGLDIHWVGLVFGITAVGLYFTLKITGRLNSVPASLKKFTALEPLRNEFRLGSLLLLSVGIFTLTTLQSTLALQGMGLGITVADTAVLNAMSLLAAVLPIHPPGGWGTIDSIQIVVLQRLNYHPGISVPIILATHCFYTVVVCAGGIVGWLVRGRLCYR